jgi:hypothetical protein
MRKLLCVVANAVPGWLFAHELMEQVFHLEFIIKAICGNRKRLAGGIDLAKRCAAPIAKTPVVFVRRFGRIGGHTVRSGIQGKSLALDKYKGAGPDLSATRAVAGSHHGGWRRQCEADGAAAATSLEHGFIPFD